MRYGIFALLLMIAAAACGMTQTAPRSPGPNAAAACGSPGAPPCPCSISTSPGVKCP